MKSKHPDRRVPIADDPLWFKDAIIYELRIRSFADSNGDGIGDFPGATERLDYLQDLGVTAIWLLPFYPSPGRDDGYDISDYTDVHPDLGTLDDFKKFLDEAHRRGMRVITELVVNHTSDQHPWFQRARRAPKGSSERAFYVWSDSPERYKDARIIFRDFEPSNWSWDPVAGQYCWHRFFAHQPDLNFENPAVQEAVLEVCDFWLELGVDGMRLDAVPYLYEQEGTNCENLPQTHVLLKKLRAHIDAKFKNRMLLAEANQWPEDAAAYFGEGDECHMNFHFPIMPRIFMSIHMEDRFPIVDILAQTPKIPDNCQWALFLRNHDELTLEMVTDDERDYMYRAYAHDPTMRINLGIRRRLAPLLGNNRRNIELMNALLCSLPGAPVLYYGDEIGMGDNVYLGDRNGVRTPMQWSADRNAGFSRANPQKLVLPIIIDPEYHYESVNVEAQQNNPNSLLWWTKRLVALRKRHQAFGRGSIEFLQPENQHVLAFLREYGDERILVVANLSRFVQVVELDLAKYKGAVPVELFGRTRFPAVGELPYMLTLSGHSFYWFHIEEPVRTAASVKADTYQAQMVEFSPPAERIFDAEFRYLLEEALPAFLESRHWYLDRGRALRALAVQEALELPGGVRLVTARLEYADGDAQSYALPMAVIGPPDAQELRARSGQAVVLNLRPPGEPESASAALVDLLGDAATSARLLEAFAPGLRARGLSCEAVSTRVRPLSEDGGLQPRYPKREHVTVAMVYGDRYLLKFYRRLPDGVAPEAEIGRFLAQAGPDAPVAPLVGTLALRARRGEPVTVAVLQGYVPYENHARAFFTEELGRYFERALTQARDEQPAGNVRSFYELLRQPVPPEIAALNGTAVEAARELGRRTAALHLALASRADDPAFGPEPFSPLDQRSVYQSMRNLTGTVLRGLRSRLAELPPEQARIAQAVLAREATVYKRFEPLLGERLTSLRTRTHGDLHLRQVLYTGRQFVILDFDGDLRQPLSHHRRKRSPLRDVATMLSSLGRTVMRVVNDPSIVRESDRRRVQPFTRLGSRWLMASYVDGYLEGSGDAAYLPRDPRELKVLLDAHMLEGALVEVARWLARPEELLVPLQFLLGALGEGQGEPTFIHEPQGNNLH